MQAWSSISQPDQVKGDVKRASLASKQTLWVHHTYLDEIKKRAAFPPIQLLLHGSPQPLSLALLSAIKQLLNTFMASVQADWKQMRVMSTMPCKWGAAFPYTPVCGSGLTSFSTWMGFNSLFCL